MTNNDDRPSNLARGAKRLPAALEREIEKFKENESYDPVKHIELYITTLGGVIDELKAMIENQQT